MKNTDLFDDYLFGKLNAQQKSELESNLKTDTVLAKAFNEHKTLVDALNKHAERNELRKALTAIHEKEFGKDAKIISIKQETFYQKLGRNVAMAAGVGLIAVLSALALFSTGGYILTKQNHQITDLKREISELKYTQDGIVSAISNVAEKPKYAPANFEGTGFAINNKGYIITSLHMIKGADSVFIENSITGRTATKIVFTDPKIDVAVLQIENAEIYKSWSLPFVFSNRNCDLGEKVFTLGYPRKDIVYGEGSLSSLSGYHRDTTMYQISIPVNPGNSGGPLLDEQGAVIGLVRGKITSAEATGFAIKSKQIINTINAFNKGLKDQEQAFNLNLKKNSLKNVKRNEQIKRINPYVFNVMVYKAN
jgi:S1-C subfamily serine protease